MDALELQAFDLGWDYATFGLCVPDDANGLFCDGYRAFNADNSKTRHQSNRFVRKWLLVRLNALRRGKAFSPEITPEYLRSITPASERCPVIGIRFTYSTGLPTDWSIDRANNSFGYVPANIIVMSQLVNEAKGDKSLELIQRLAAESVSVEGLEPEQWQRLAVIVAPAFGDKGESSAVTLLFGQPVALGMPVSPVASLQIALSRAMIAGWDRDRRQEVLEFVNDIKIQICRTKSQNRAFIRLIREILRRSANCSYTEIWSTKRVQRHFGEFIASLSGPALRRLLTFHESRLGPLNTRFD